MKIVVKGIWLWSSLEGNKKENKITLEKKYIQNQADCKASDETLLLASYTREKKKSSSSVRNVYFF